MIIKADECNVSHNPLVKMEFKQRIESFAVRLYNGIKVKYFYNYIIFLDLLRPFIHFIQYI